MEAGSTEIAGLGLARLSLDEAVAEVLALVDSGAGGSVFTPNLDHVVRLRNDVTFAQAYAQASLVQRVVS